MSQPLRVAGFEPIISGRFWVIAEDSSFKQNSMIVRKDKLFSNIALGGSNGDTGGEFKSAGDNHDTPVES